MKRLRSPAYEEKALDILFIFNERFCSPAASDEVLRMTHDDYLPHGEKKHAKKSRTTRILEMTGEWICFQIPMGEYTFQSRAKDIGHDASDRAPHGPGRETPQRGHVFA